MFIINILAYVFLYEYVYLEYILSYHKHFSFFFLEKNIPLLLEKEKVWGSLKKYYILGIFGNKFYPYLYFVCRKTMTD